MHIAVCIKPVPDPKTANNITLDPVTKRIRREQGGVVINPLDRNALEAAVALKEKEGGDVTVFAMAPPAASNVLRETLALGADKAYLLSDRAFGGSDTLATTNILAAGLKYAGKERFWDLILFGAYSSDGGTAQVPAQLGEWLGLANFHFVSKLDYGDGVYSFSCDYGDRLLEWRSPAPLVLSVTRNVNKPRYTTIRGVMKAKNKEIVTLTAKELDVDPLLLGLDGSPTRNGEVYPVKAERGCEKISGSNKEIAARLFDILVHNGAGVLR